MKIPSPFNFLAMQTSDAHPTWFKEHLTRLNTQLNRIGQSLTGPTSFDAGNSGAAKTILPYTADLIKLTLTANTTITLDMNAQTGAEGLLELAQDATGGRTVAWTNALWTGGSAPVITATALKRDLIGLTYRGDGGWVARVLASNY